MLVLTIHQRETILISCVYKGPQVCISWGLTQYIRCRSQQERIHHCKTFILPPPHKKKDWTRKKMKWCNHTNMTPPSGHGAWDSVKVKDYILSSYPVFSRNTFPKPSFMGWSPVLYLLGDMVKIYCPFMQTNKLECSCRTLVLISLSWAMVLNRTDMESTFEPGCSLPKCVCCVLGSWQGLFFFFSFFDPTSWYISLIWLSTQI